MSFEVREGDMLNLNIARITEQDLYVLKGKRSRDMGTGVVGEEPS